MCEKIVWDLEKSKRRSHHRTDNMIITCFCPLISMSCPPPQSHITVKMQNWRISLIGESWNIFPSKIISVEYNFNLSPNISFWPIKGSSCQLVCILRKKCKIYQHRWLFRSRDEKALVERRKMQKYHQIKSRSCDFCLFLHRRWRISQVYSNICMSKPNRTILIFWELSLNRGSELRDTTNR